MVRLAPKKPVVQSSISKPEQIVRYSHRTWDQFKLIQKALEGLTGNRLFYFDGTIEILMPGKNHELFKSIIAILIEAFLFQQEIEFVPTGSMTQEYEGYASGEPDESYQIGEFKLIIEVTVSSSSISKQGLYQALGIHELWFWEDGLLSVYHLTDKGYQKCDRSLIPVLNTLNLERFTQCILMGETSCLKARKHLLASDTN